MSTVAIYQRLVVAGGGFFLLLDLGPGAAACGMGIEINTGYRCYLSAACRRRGRFFSPIGSGPGGSGLWNGYRDKHWVQLLFPTLCAQWEAFFVHHGLSFNSFRSTHSFAGLE